jgi:WD40 repeat protein
MVSWSNLTPYRLVTAAADGHARRWDVREACLNRYRKHVGKRPEYRLDDVAQTTTESEPADAGDALVAHPPLPPLPVRLEETIDGPVDENSASGASIALPLLALPPGALDAPVAGQPGQHNGENDGPGEFVANDLIDEGVRLLEKLRHGASIEEQLAGPGTRARRAPKVICIARCSHGGHFATGSDDGICRIWKDEDDERVRAVDMKLSGMASHEPRAYESQRIKSTSKCCCVWNTGRPCQTLA